MRNTQLSPVNRAIEYIRSTVLSPALNSALPLEIKNKVKHVNRWLPNFKRVGDLSIYLSRFDGGRSSAVYSEMKAHGLTTFEDISSEFNRRFSRWIKDATRPSDFVVGENYSPYLRFNFDSRRVIITPDYSALNWREQPYGAAAQEEEEELEHAALAPLRRSVVW